ncbi:BMP family protein [Sulfitobacter mediterraneus]|uniref:BMP family protein n=1 Tax=Sulfitobacter mediterraneus TaxID=83219 RepID=UPI0021A6DD4E|nr:BMP family protein [Sulfitobacter mediterraneus]UWR12448.1 BMP family protein [Sulfitobacter mediterraneus]
MLAGPAASDAFERAAIVMPGSISDNGWNQAGFEGLTQAGEALGFETAFSESVHQPEQIEVLSDYARRGYDLVIGHGGEFQDAVERVAIRFPETMFMVNNGLGTKENLANADFYFSQIAYLMGYIGGSMTQSDMIGIIAAQKFKFTTDTVVGYEAGAKAANPDVSVLVTWTGDWDDIAKGKEAALNQISQGADVVWPTMDSATLGSMQAVQEKGVYGIGIYRDAINEWPEILQSAILDVRGNMRSYLERAAVGELDGVLYRADMNNELAMRIGSFHPDIPAELVDEIAKLIDAMKSGALVVEPR